MDGESKESTATPIANGSEVSPTCVGAVLERFFGKCFDDHAPEDISVVGESANEVDDDAEFNEKMGAFETSSFRRSMIEESSTSMQQRFHKLKVISRLISFTSNINTTHLLQIALV